MKIKKPKSKKRNIFYYILVALSFAIITFSIYTIWNNTKPSNNTSQTQNNRPVNDVDYSGPNKDDLENSQNAKKRSTESGNSTNSDNLATVTVGVVYADIEGDYFEIRAFTPSLIEGAGTCTATIKNGEKTVVGKSESFIDATSSQCRPIQIPLSSINPRGQWKLKVEYKSNKAEGSSQEEVVNI